MEKTTVSELGSHAWYRLLKVIYIGFFVSLGFLTIIFIYYSNRQSTVFDGGATVIDCHLPAEHTITASEGGLYFTPFDFPNGEYNHQRNADIQNACGMTEYVNMAISKKLVQSLPTPLFTVQPVFKSTGGWTAIMGYSLLDILVLIALFEGLKRIFYYIVLGTFTPNK